MKNQKATKCLDEMLIGEQGMVFDLKNIEKSTLHRFMDLGIAPFAKIQLIKKMHFNQLYIIDVDDVEICIRQNDAKKIMVQI